ncbi:hypothetical protein C8R45DRAFT_598153 [Mycena sanguinolenta]|nr:hypothetical protein C8R45DRAFT_598153 [Mycena sanguinolenta]
MSGEWCFHVKLPRKSSLSCPAYLCSVRALCCLYDRLNALHFDWHDIIRRIDNSDSLPEGYLAFLPALLQADHSCYDGSLLSVRYSPHAQSPESAWCNTCRLRLGGESLICIHSRFAYALRPRVQSELNNDLEKPRTCILKAAHFCGTSRLSSISEILSSTLDVPFCTRHRWICAVESSAPVCVCPPRSRATEPPPSWSPSCACSSPARIRRAERP